MKLKRRTPSENDVVLELQVVDNAVFAAVRVPGRCEDRFQLQQLPIHHAAAIAIRIAGRLGTGVAVVDTHGLWPD